MKFPYPIQYQFVASLPLRGVGKPRMTQRDKWQQRPCVMHYRAFADALREKLKGIEFPEEHCLIFRFATKNRKLWGEFKRTRPDADNLLKSILDVLFKEDSHICDGRVIKVWAEHDAIEIYKLVSEVDA